MSFRDDKFDSYEQSMREEDRVTRDFQDREWGADERAVLELVSDSRQEPTDEELEKLNLEYRREELLRQGANAIRDEVARLKNDICFYKNLVKYVPAPSTSALIDRLETVVSFLEGAS